MSNRSTIVLGTRGSELAMWQTHWVHQQLLKLQPGLHIEVHVVKTQGDKILDAPLSRIGDKGLFTKELENALLDGRVDLAVHSLKDVPTQLEQGLTIGAVCEREDVSDVFIAHPEKKCPSLSSVPMKGTIATGSLRRRCQLLRLRPDLSIVELRGNLGTRVEKLKSSQWDGMLLAKAGITRLGRSELISEVLSPTTFLPAVGQGALAVEARSNDERILSFVRPLDHIATRQATQGERALLRRLEGGCQIPIGAYGRIDHGTFRLDAIIGSLDGSRSVRSSIEGSPDHTERLGVSLAERLLADGGEAILDEIRELNT